MKKIITILLILILTLMLLVSCDDRYSYQLYEENGIEIAYSEKLKDAVVGKIHCDSDCNDMNIEIPNTFRDAKVTSLGGLVASSAGVHFGVSGILHQVGEDYNTKTEIDSLLNANFKEYEIKEITINLHIGANLKSVDNAYSRAAKSYDVTVEEGNKIIILFCFSITVDNDNETFYSDELGRMYYTENNKLVKTFLYHNRDSFPEHSL